MLNTLGNYNVTAAADTLAKIYVDYIDKDIDIYFFDRFSQLLNNNPEIMVLFPSTTVYLDNVPNYQYTAMLTSLRTAFYKDLKALPGDVAAIANLDTSTCCNSAKSRIKCQERVALLESLFQTEQGMLVITGLYVADGAINTTSPAVVLNNIASNHAIKYAADTEGVVPNLIRLLNAISISLLNPNDSTTWLSVAQWDTIKKNPDSLAVLVDSLIANVAAANIIIGGKDISAEISNSAGLSNYIGNLIQTGYTLDTVIRRMRAGDTTAAAKVKNMALFVENFRQFFNVVTNYAVINPAIPVPKIQVQRVFSDINGALEISKDILLKDYQSAVFSSIVLVDSLLPTKAYTNSRGKVHINKHMIRARKEAKKKYYNRIAKTESAHKKALLATDATHDKAFVLVMADSARKREALLNKEKTLSGIRNWHEKHELKKAIESNDTSKLNSAYANLADDDSTNDKAVKNELEKETLGKAQFKQNFLKYGLLLADVVMADSADQITNAFEAAAEPPGSSIVKKTANFSVAVQGYGGLSTGFAGHGIGDNFFRNFNSLNPYAPLGISVSMALKSRNPSNKYTAGSLSLFVSLIDIGAIVAYDFNNMATKTPDTVSVKLANIFAPGANLVYGIPGLPLSVGGGFQYLPLLQIVKDNGLSTTSGFRWQLFAAFDLSFFNLYVSKR